MTLHSLYHADTGKDYVHSTDLSLLIYETNFNALFHSLSFLLIRWKHSNDKYTTSRNSKYIFLFWICENTRWVAFQTSSSKLNYLCLSSKAGRGQVYWNNFIHTQGVAKAKDKETSNTLFSFARLQSMLELKLGRCIAGRGWADSLHQFAHPTLKLAAKLFFPAAVYYYWTTPSAVYINRINKRFATTKTLC